LLRGPKFAGASPPAAHDQDLIGKSVARRRQAIAGAMERATRAAGLLLDLEPMAWGTTAEFTCDAWGCGLTVGA